MDIDFSLVEFFETCLKGLDYEIKANKDYLKRAGLIGGIDVSNGSATQSGDVGENSTEDEPAHQLVYYDFTYDNPLAFEMDGKEIPVDLPPGTPCSFSGRGINVTGRIQEHDPDKKELIVGLQQPVGEESVEGKLQFDLAYLLESLNDAIRNVQRKCKLDALLRSHCEQFVHGDWHSEASSEQLSVPETIEQSRVLNEYQREAVTSALGPTHHLVWGPPGTGKTLTLGAAANAATYEGVDGSNKLLVAAHTNVALDNAIRSITEQWSNLTQSDRPSEFADDVALWRRGRPLYLERCSERHCDALFDKLARAHNGFRETLDELESRISRIDDDWHLGSGFSLRRRASFADQRARIADEHGGSTSELEDLADTLHEQFRSVQKQALAEAKIVCSTLSGLHLDFDTYSQFDWERAFVDEISMVGMAQLIPVLSLHCPVVGFGDFQQLPPIVRSIDTAAKRALGMHLFEWVDCDDTNTSDERRTMLKRQYRMAEPICEPIKRTFYDDKLETAPSVIDRHSRFRWATSLLDTAKLDTEVESAGDSKRNDAHAEVASSVVRALTSHEIADIGVITPYSAQAEQIRRKLEELTHQNPGIETSTVHSYQGREKKVVIFDSMTSPGEPLSFLKNRVNPAISQMLNVAYSRAEEHLLLLSDTAALADHFSGTEPLRKTIGSYRLRMPEPGRSQQLMPHRNWDKQVEQFVCSLVKT